MIWHVIYADKSGAVQSRAARSSDHALAVARELLQQSCEVRRIIAPDGSMIERAQIDAHCAGAEHPQHK